MKRMFPLLLLSFLPWLGVSEDAAAQNTTCATRPFGDNSNACSSTAFVAANAISPLSHIPITINLTGLPDKTNGSRGPLFIWNNASINTLGQALGFQVWIGDNPTGTPGVGDSIIATWYINNLNGRAGIWTGNFIQQQGGVADGGGVGIAHGLELDNIAGQTLSTTQSVFNALGGAVHAIEAVASANTGLSPTNPQAALWIWSARFNVPTEWWNYGVACARVRIACVIGETIIGDGTSPFNQALIWDKTIGGNASLKISGSLFAGIDLSDNPTLSMFVRGSATTTTDFVFDNNADFAQQITISAGSSTSQNSSIALADFAQARKWALLKDTSNNLDVQNAVTGHNTLTFNISTDIGTFFASPIVPLAAGYIKSTGATNQLSSAATVPTTDLSGQVTLAQLPTLATNTILGNATSGSATPLALAIGTCSTASSAVIWTTNTGFGCNTSISAAKWTTARNLAGNSVDGSANVAFANKFIVQGTTDTGLTGAQFLGALGTGIMKNTTTTGVVSIITEGTGVEAALGATVSGSGSLCLTTNCAMVTPNLGTPSAVTLTNGTSLPISTGVSGLGTNVATALAGGAWVAYTPNTPTSTSGTITTASATGKYMQLGKVIFFSLVATITTNGTGSGAIRTSLPVAAKDNGAPIFGRETALAGFSLQGLTAATATTLDITKYDNTYPGANGYVLTINGVYEAN